MNLVYTVLGFSENYTECLQYFLKSLIKSSVAFNNFELLIMCDKKLYDIILKIVNLQYLQINRNKIKCFIISDSRNVMEASINKLKVFEYIDIYQYKSVLYVDTDVLFTKNMNDFFNEINLLEEDILYVSLEKKDVLSHNIPFWSYGNFYNEKELLYFKEKNIYPFNAGCFLFIPSTNMKNHFSNVLFLIEKSKRPLFFEQSMLNMYFNKLERVNNSKINDSNYILFPDEDKHYANCIIHFCGSPGNGVKKIDMIKKYYLKNIEKNNKTV